MDKLTSKMRTLSYNNIYNLETNITNNKEIINSKMSQILVKIS
jgi:hypothetical protein